MARRSGETIRRLDEPEGGEQEGVPPEVFSPICSEQVPTIGLDELTAQCIPPLLSEQPRQALNTRGPMRVHRPKNRTRVRLASSDSAKAATGGLRGGGETSGDTGDTGTSVIQKYHVRGPCCYPAKRTAIETMYLHSSVPEGI